MSSASFHFRVRWQNGSWRGRRHHKEDLRMQINGSNTFIEQFQSFIKNVGAGIEAVEKRAKEIAEILQPALDQLRANMQLMPERTKKLQRNLAKRGWYLLPQTPVTFYKFENESDQSPDEVDSSMTELVEHYLSEIELDLIAEFPSRAAIFREAFQAHHDGKYASAITLLLTQADGIVSDVLGRSFFSKERSSADPRTRILIEELQLDMYREMMLEPLMTRGGVSANEQELHLYPTVYIAIRYCTVSTLAFRAR